MESKNGKYRVPASVIRNANSRLIRVGTKENSALYNGSINLSIKTNTGVLKKSFTNSDIKREYAKALDMYAERI